MSESKFTPGPWEDRKDLSILSIRRRTANANVFNKRISWQEKKANARLIAAAPDMYEAILSVLHADACGFAGMMDSALTKARAAIAKADGKS